MSNIRPISTETPHVSAVPEVFEPESMSLNLSGAATAALDEETARAEMYGVLAQFYYAPPDALMLEALRVAVTEAPVAGGFLQDAWQNWVSVARQLDDSAIQNEYAQLFGGLGKPEIYVFGSHYLSGFLNEKPLVKLRTDLSQLGLARAPSMPETEDHFAYLCEVMRYLIAGDDVELCNLTQQRQFFVTHIRPWIERMCEAMINHPKAQFYAALACLTRDFTNVETQGFDMLG